MDPRTPPLPTGYEDVPDGPGHLPDPRLSRATGLLLVGLFVFYVLLVLLGV